MSGLRGKRVAVLEARMGSELAGLIGRHGGLPISVPALKETPVAPTAETLQFVADLCDGRFPVVVFLTGAGATALLKEAEQLGRLDAAIGALRGAITVCRGPKPVAVLRRHDVKVDVTAPEPHTTTELLEALTPIDLRDKRVAVVQYGERNDRLTEGLRGRSAAVSEICLYEWQLPDDVSALEQLVEDVIARRLDALVVTSQVQVRHLFQIAARRRRETELADALNTGVVVAAVGPVCAAALRSAGVVPRVEPAHPKMGPMVMALADYFELTR